MAEITLAVAPIAFKAVVGAWKTFDDALSFSEDSGDLVLRLETIRAHLSIWASRSELNKGTLHTNLIPFDELIAKALNRICSLISDIERLGKDYGLVRKSGEEESVKPTGTIIQMRRSLQNALAHSKAKSKLEELLEHEASSRGTLEKEETRVVKRISWAVRDKKKFEGFVTILETHVNGLHKLLPEAERKGVQQEETRFGLQVIREMSDLEPLSRLHNASGWYQGSSEFDVSSLAQWKAIAIQSAPMNGLGWLQAEGLAVADLSLSNRTKVRFLERSSADANTWYLFEKKEYDTNISDVDKDLLKERIRKLVSLLGGLRAQQHLHTLQAVDYMDDPEFHCWWIVFRFPLPTFGIVQSDEREPLSLRRLYSSPFKPALEQRYALARRLVGTFANLYGSDWMHKSINSGNIIFPQLADNQCVSSFRAINSALVQGFGYSRQHMEAQTIDRGKVLGDLESAIYRHPNYQGEAASGYRIQYDIYSLGLVLFELAIWAPLMDILAARPRAKPPIDLSRDMLQFHTAEAVELKRRIMIRVDNELPYRVGTKFMESVKWCLTLEEPVTAIEFYNTVVIPLSEL